MQLSEKTVRFWDHKIADSDPDQASKAGSYLKFAKKNVRSNDVAFTPDGARYLQIQSGDAYEMTRLCCRRGGGAMEMGG